MNAMAALLTARSQVEVVSEDPNDLAQFGLDHPKVVDDDRGARQAAADQDSRSATRTRPIPRSTRRSTAVPKVFLLGENIEYYQTLMFQWVEGKQGKNA